MAKQKKHEKPGRPEGSYKYTVMEIQDAWQRYKSECKAAVKFEVSAGKVLRVPCPQVYTLADFQVFIGTTRQTWSDYRDRAEYAEVITGIEEEVLACKGSALLNGRGSTAGIIFDLKCNHNWIDKQQIEAKVDVTSVEVKLVPATAMTIATSEKEVEDSLQ
ncbi:terminase small subunit [Chitinophaga sp. HK235]|uniref:terminase small subunit n=1 Tax=Chitinophaga sp. HK235 TaxID=2952571 RepID=UPI001BAB3E06|nr:terminase small subunit [Chitinophaga sp. HK235]